MVDINMGVNIIPPSIMFLVDVQFSRKSRAKFLSNVGAHAKLYCQFRHDFIYYYGSTHDLVIRTARPSYSNK